MFPFIGAFGEVSDSDEEEIQHIRGPREVDPFELGDSAFKKKL